MRLLIIDRDTLSNQLLQSRLEGRNYEITVEPSKNDALELLKEHDFDVILFDPAPIQDARAIIISIFKTIRGRFEPQFLLLSKTMSAEDAVAAGANDLIPKPVGTQELEEKLDNIDRLVKLIHKMEKSEDLPPQRGIINKDAFNELFLSAIDRAHRYAERSYVVFITIDAAGETLKHACEKLRYIRRQSDVIGRTGEKEFGILLQRPQYESEPYDATTRFTEVLSQFVSELEEGHSIQMDLKLIEIPVGKQHIHTRVTEEETSVVEFSEGL